MHGGVVYFYFSLLTIQARGTIHEIQNIYINSAFDFEHSGVLNEHAQSTFLLINFKIRMLTTLECSASHVCRICFNINFLIKYLAENKKKN